ncbi:MAG: hypothetical protein KDL87_13535, partial [Verrucomicrobiae bacterium]|nr:hypothetical protein [Verrucomicrobiae bacterium]
GNVIVSCSACNREKRRDDQNLNYSLGNYGWESFLSHDGTICDPSCKSCAHWANLLPDSTDRIAILKTNKEKLRQFRARPEVIRAVQIGEKFQSCSRPLLETLYRSGQELAIDLINDAYSKIEHLLE